MNLVRWLFQDEQGMRGVHGFFGKVCLTLSCLAPSLILFRLWTKFTRQSEMLQKAREERLKTTSKCAIRNDPGYKKVLGVIKAFMEDSHQSSASGEFNRRWDYFMEFLSMRTRSFLTIASKKGWETFHGRFAINWSWTCRQSVKWNTKATSQFSHPWRNGVR